MKGTTLLERQHRRVEQLLEAVEGERYVRDALLRELADDLAATIALEEVVFYPALHDILGAAHAYVQSEGHALAMDALERVLATQNDPVAFLEALAALRFVVRDHFRREETSYPVVERRVGGDELERIGAQMRKLHQQLTAEDAAEPISSFLSRADRDSFVPFQVAYAPER